MPRANEATTARLLSEVDSRRDELANLLSNLIQFRTVNYGDAHDGFDGIPNGNELPCAIWLRDWLRNARIPSDVYEAAPTRGSLIARLPGDGRHPDWRLTTPSLMLMSHLDVVPVEDAHLWPYPPFSGVIADGNVFGRGSRDAKGIAAASAMAMAVIRSADVRLAGDLVMLAAADEESGGRFGAGWVTAHPDLGARVRTTAALNEGGGSVLTLPENGLGYTWATGEKGRLEVTLVVSGSSGHASAPWRAQNSLERAATVLGRLHAYSPDIHTTHPIFEALRKAFGFPGRLDPATLDRFISTIGEVGRGAVGLMLGASRITIVPTMIQAGVKSNSIPGTCTITCDVRALPGQDLAFVQSVLTAIMDGLPWVTISIAETAISNDSPWDHPLRDAATMGIRSATRRPDVVLLPALCAGFTDSRFARANGTHVFDCAPGDWRDTSTDTGVHGTNERIPIDSLVTMTRFFVATACNYLGFAD